MRHVQHKTHTLQGTELFLLNLTEHEDTRGHGFCLTLQLFMVTLIISTIG